MINYALLDSTRRQNPHYRYPALILADLRDLWPAPEFLDRLQDAKYRDWHPALILGVQRHLESCRQEAELKNALTWIAIRVGRLTNPTIAEAVALEIGTQWEVGLRIWEARQAPPPSPVEEVRMPPQPPQLSLEEKEANKRARDAARALLPKHLQRGANG